MGMLTRILALCLMLLGAAWAAPAHAEPAKVIVGAYVNKIQDLNFKDNKYTLDFFIWFRWKPVGVLADYKPLESFEIINGKIENKASVVEKKIGDVNYASARITATMAETWELNRFPFDSHQMQAFIEDSSFTTVDVVFEVDKANSRLGDEIDLSGWRAGGFSVDVVGKTYASNYGDISQPTGNKSEYSRFIVTMGIERLTLGAAFKLLSTVLLAVAVAFVAFTIRASDLDARFGMGIGALFAVAASAFVAASAVPDSGGMTIADEMHMVALGFIFASLVVSSFCLKLEESEREALAARIDKVCVFLFPIAFYSWALFSIARAIR